MVRIMRKNYMELWNYGIMELWNYGTMGVIEL